MKIFQKDTLICIFEAGQVKVSFQKIENKAARVMAPWLRGLATPPELLDSVQS